MPGNLTFGKMNARIITGQNRLLLDFDTCGCGSSIGGRGLIWVDPSKFIFEFERGKLKISHF